MLRSARWRVCARPSMMLTAAVTAMTVLCLAGCASSRKSVRQEAVWSREASRLDVDSTASVAETWQTPVKVPMSAVSLTLRADSLLALPPGAAYTARQGQASVRVTRRAPTAEEPERLVIEAGCDSLELVCMSYARTVSTLKRQLREASSARHELAGTSSERRQNGVLTAFKWLLAGFLAGLLLGGIRPVLSFIKKIIKK